MNGLTLVISALLAAPGVTNKVGSRVNPGVAPQSSALPDIIVYQVSGLENYHLQGANQYPDDRISIECRGASYQEVDELGDAVVVALRDFNSVLSGYHLTLFKEGSDIYDYGEDFGIHRRIIDFRARYQAVI